MSPTTCATGSEIKPPTPEGARGQDLTVLRKNSMLNCYRLRSNPYQCCHHEGSPVLQGAIQLQYCHLWFAGSEGTDPYSSPYITPFCRSVSFSLIPSQPKVSNTECYVLSAVGGGKPPTSQGGQERSV